MRILRPRIRSPETGNRNSTRTTAGYCHNPCAIMRTQTNNRFVAGETENDGLHNSIRRPELIEKQNPIAIILGCSDSRVPAELVFNQGLGDLFVIRVAGNIVAPSQVASVEYCAEQFKTQLVVVMGHTNCGAVTATLSELRIPPEERSENLHAIVSRIRPSVETLLETDLVNRPKELLHAAVRSNVRACVSHLKHGSKILEHLHISNGLQIVGAEYSLETGKVEFFDSDVNLAIE